MKKFLVLLVALLLFASCGRKPYDKPEFVEIKSNETAFIVPLVGKSNSQSTFMSEDYLRENMVATKRVQITHEWVQTGRKSHQGEYKPTIKVVIVDRTPVSVSWSGAPDTKIGVESKGSIGFTIPISLTAMIEQEDAPRFLYKYTEGKSLLAVVNTDINAFIRTQASQRFGVESLENCKLKKKDILESIFVDAKKFFKEYGITISQFGMTDGFLYDDSSYQEAINKQAVLFAEGKNLEQKELNARKQRAIELANAQNERDIAATKASAVSSLRALQDVENSKIMAQAQADAIRITAEKGIKLPDIMPESAFYTLGLDSYIPTAKK